MVKGSTTELATLEVDYDVSPTEDHEVAFELELDPKLNKKKLESLSIFMYNRGVAPNHNHYKVSESFISVPTWKR